MVTFSNNVCVRGLQAHLHVTDAVKLAQVRLTCDLGNKNAVWLSRRFSHANTQTKQTNTLGCVLAQHKLALGLSVPKHLRPQRQSRGSKAECAQFRFRLMRPAVPKPPTVPLQKLSSGCGQDGYGTCPGVTWSNPVAPKSAASITFGKDPVLLGRLRSASDTLGKKKSSVA